MSDIEERVVKRRRVSPRDHDRLREFVFEELQRRKTSQWRLAHEKIWKEVDRQIAMNPPVAVPRSGNPEEAWHSTVQLGLLADASEILAADTLRLAIPTDRNWFRPHIELPSALNPDGSVAVTPPREQRSNDQQLRAFMAQQQADFGFRDRVKLSVKEALHHGSFVAEVRMQRMAKWRDGSRAQVLLAPVWVPHSMWHCYPDSSPQVIGTDLFYQGSMILESMMKFEDVLRRTDYKNLDKVQPKRSPNGAKNDVQIITYYGNASLPRTDGHMFLPNRKLVFANEVLVFSEVNPLPFPPILYAGHERDDVRDPYYSSPLVKRSPMAKMASVLANKFLDAVDLKTEPPLVYEKHDSFFAKHGGPAIYPGAKNATSGLANFKLIETADPSWAQQGLAFSIGEVEKGTGVDATRSGVSAATEQTATEVVKKDQKSEIRTVDFVGVLERQALRPWLYMQHELNRSKLSVAYPFYNNDIASPDFLRARGAELPESVVFEITGSRQLLGEEQRTLRFRENATFAAGVEPIAAITDWQEVAEELWSQSGMKDPERFSVAAQGQDNSVPAEQVQQLQLQFEEAQASAQEQMQQLGEQAQAAEQKVAQLELQKQALQSQIAAKETDRNALDEALKLNERMQRAKDELAGIQEQIRRQAAQLESASNQEASAVRESANQSQSNVQEVLGRIDESEAQRRESEAERDAFKERVLAEMERRGEGELVTRLRGAGDAEGR